MKILVLDTETTDKVNLNNMQDVIEIGITEVDTEKYTIRKMYDQLVGYDLMEVPWGNNYVWIFDTAKAIAREEVDLNEPGNKDLKPVEQVASEVRDIIRGNNATSYNLAFDFGEFLSKDPWYLKNDHLNPRTYLARAIKNGTVKKGRVAETTLDFNIAPCIMISATRTCAIPGRYGYKWPKLDEALSILGVSGLDIRYDDYSASIIEDDTKRHRAYYDCVQAATVLLALDAENAYPYDKMEMYV